MDQVAQAINSIKGDIEDKKLNLIVRAIKAYGIDAFIEETLEGEKAFPEVLNGFLNERDLIGNDAVSDSERGYVLEDFEVLPNVDTFYTPASSYVEQRLKFTDDRKLKLVYESIFGNCRIGRLLESLDVISGIAAYKYVLGANYPAAISLDYKEISKLMPFEKPTALVTASCSELVLHETEIPLDSDVLLDAKVVFVGSSSLEIATGVYSQDKKLLLSASFTFVGVSMSGKCVLPPLILETEEDIKASELAQAQKKVKIVRSKALLEIPTNVDQNIVLRDLLTNFPEADLNNMTLKTYTVMHPEHKNIHGKIFGGFLMRTAAEVAWSCAYLCTRTVPEYKVIKEQMFLAPVEVSDVCLFEAQVIAVEGHIVHIVVTTEVQKPKNRTKTMTNRFYYEFLCQ